MRHHNSVRKFGRTRSQRNALIKSLALSLIVHGRIETTEAKAKEVAPYVEKLVTKAKEGTLASQRLVTSRLINRKEEANKLIDEIATRYKDRTGGYTRVLKLPKRLSDAAPMALVEFV